MQDELWDAVVVGAGPAGSVAAALLAARGWRVLLVERAAWPREKACGGCVNAAAVGLLGEVGLGAALHGGAALTRMVIRAGLRELALALPTGVAIERRELDANLVTEAVRRGVVFRDGVRAQLAADAGEGHREMQVGTEHVQARVVLACDGLHGTLLRDEPWAAQTRAARTRLGFSATVPRTSPAGELSMYVGRAGYVGLVGLVGLAEDRTHVGAALWPESCHAARGPAGVINDILGACDAAPLPAETPFHGTGPLTVHRAAVAGPRVLAIGDACGYVEPFTGEGISWAIRGAVEAVRLLPVRADQWHAGLTAQWQARFETHVRQRQHWCRRLRSVLQRPRLAAGCLALARCVPAAPAALARRICA